MTHHALVVDDKLENRYLLRALLTGNGFEVTEANDGQAALEEARKRLPDILISDLLMPVMDGYTLLREWKADEHLRRIPFIVYTATYTEPKDEKLALDLGADAFIVKPSEPELFLARVREVLARAETGQMGAHAPRIEEEEAYKTYSEVLVKKVEKKNRELEQRALELEVSEEHIRRLNRLYLALSETNQSIVHLHDREELFRAICRIAVERGGFALAWIGWLNTGNGDIDLLAWAGESRVWFDRLPRFNIRGARAAPVEIALSEEQIYLCNDLLASPRHAPLHAIMREAGLRAGASLPLRLGGHIVGALTLFSDEPEFFDDQLMSLVIEMASDVSFALENFEREELRRQAEEELRQAYLDLEQKVAARTRELASANKDLEAYAYTVSHDLRAPLRGIDGFTRMVLERNRNRLDAADQELLQRVLASAGRMGALIDDLLQLSTLSRQTMQIETVDLSHLAEDILGELRGGKPQARFAARITPGCCARGDARLLRMLLANLIENAVKYSARVAEPCVEFGQEQQGGSTVFLVRDNGAGFDMNLADKLFQPFQRYHHPDDFEGTGIGLATVARIVERHGGRIWAESATGQGAVFRFTLAA
ncbi:MAG: response regulator [Betaproteobacteria bacterium]|nr:response regulator [Betaproteobacteria bacterium]